jgi:prevent-host-death family protein
MRGIDRSDAKAHSPQLLDEVECGETIIITRHSRPVARIMPEADNRSAETRKAMDRITAFRQTMPDLSVDVILSACHEVRKY